MFTLLTERQILVLKAIVEEFIQTAQPVGSRVLSKKEDLNFSAATIRNDMVDLEDLGFIEKLIHQVDVFLVKRVIVIM